MSNSIPSAQYQIEFIGGPFDGHLQDISLAPGELAEMVLLPVNENMLRMVQGQHRGPKAVPTSVAMYSLEQHEGRWRYRYGWAASPDALQLSEWRA